MKKMALGDGNMAIGYFFLGDTGFHVAQHLAQKLPNMQFISLHKTSYMAQNYRTLLALAETHQTQHHCYDNIPDYIECLHGKMLFCSVPETQFGSLDAGHCTERIAGYADLVMRMMAPYDRIVLIMRPGQASGELCADYCVTLAKTLDKSVHIMTTRGLLFEQQMKRLADIHLRQLKRLGVPIHVIEVPIHKSRILDTYSDLYAAMARQVATIDYEKV